MLQDLIMLGVAVGTASTTLTQSRIFRWLHTESGEGKPGWAERVHPFLGELLSCPYCTGHWLAAVTVVVFWQITTSITLPDDIFGLIVWWLATTGFAALTSGLISLLFSKGSSGE